MIMVKTLRRISASDSFDLKHANQETDHGGTELALGRDWTVGLGLGGGRVEYVAIIHYAHSITSDSVSAI
jgi:hypothetical protein